MSTVEERVRQIVVEPGGGFPGHGGVGNGARGGVQLRNPRRGSREDHDGAASYGLHQRAPRVGVQSGAAGLEEGRESMKG